MSRLPFGAFNGLDRNPVHLLYLMGGEGGRMPPAGLSYTEFTCHDPG